MCVYSCMFQFAPNCFKFFRTQQTKSRVFYKTLNKNPSIPITTKKQQKQTKNEKTIRKSVGNPFLEGLL